MSWFVYDLVYNYRTINLYNEIFSLFIENDLISQNKSDFEPVDTCTNQLLSITLEIFKSFDDGWEVRGVFLDISKTFDKVWHEGLLLKLRLKRISGNLLKFMEDFLEIRYHRIVLNWQVSKWAAVKAGVPQGSIYGLLLFLIYNNNLSNELSPNPRLYADDTFLFSVVRDTNLLTNALNNALKLITRHINRK